MRMRSLASLLAALSLSGASGSDRHLVRRQGSHMSYQLQPDGSIKQVQFERGVADRHGAESSPPRWRQPAEATPKSALLEDGVRHPQEDVVYNIAFQRNAERMCLQEEFPGCSRSSRACDVTFCKMPGDGITQPADGDVCKCMNVEIGNCQNAFGENYMQIFTKSEVIQDHMGRQSTYDNYLWRALRVKYIDQTSWGSGRTDPGKILESAVVCQALSGCKCQGSHWYRWKLDDGKIKWQPQGGDVSMGPIPMNTPRFADLVTIRAFNNQHEDGDMSFVRASARTLPPPEASDAAVGARTPEAKAEAEQMAPEEFEQGALFERGEVDSY